MILEPSISSGAVMVRVDGGRAFMPMVLSRKVRGAWIRTGQKRDNHGIILILHFDGSKIRT
jgi:hypothetical protein